MADELLDIAHGDARLAEKIRGMLASIAEGKDETLREMARGVLDGGSLREAATSSAYGEAVGAAFNTFWAKYSDMSPSERAELEELGQADLDAP